VGNVRDEELGSSSDRLRVRLRRKAIANTGYCRRLDSASRHQRADPRKQGFRAHGGPSAQCGSIRGRCIALRKAIALLMSYIPLHPSGNCLFHRLVAN
jgi:hypothetical protein